MPASTASLPDLRAADTTSVIPFDLFSVFASLAALATALRLVPGVSVYDGHRLVEAALLCAVAVDAAYRGTGARMWRQMPGNARLALGLTVALGFVSASQSARPADAVLEVVHLALMGVGVCWAAQRMQEVPGRRWHLLVALGAAALLTALGVGMAYGMHLAGMGVPLFPRAGVQLSHVRLFNQVQTWTLPLMPLLVLRAPTRALRGLAAAGLAVWWALLFASGGRATFLGAVLGVLLVAALLRRRAGAWLRVQGMTVALGVLVYVVLFRIVVSSADDLVARAAFGDSQRFELWSVALEHIRQHPWLGIGPMHFAYRMPILHSAHPHDVSFRWPQSGGWRR